MKYFQSHFIAIALVFFVVSCEKKTTEPAVQNKVPTNLVINATVSNDASGKVTFSATADNAVTYKFELGNGDVMVEPSGIANYKYTENGTNAYTVTVTATSSTGQTLSKTKDITVTVDLLSQPPFWSEEFDVAGAPNPTKWVYDIGTGSNGWGNAELQYYTDRSQNVIIDNGTLKIKAVKENYSGSSWTSTRLKTLSKFAFKYGTVVIRAKVPAGVGTWPAVWMMGTDIGTVGWPACGEIDILEHVGKEQNKVFASLHYPGRTGGNAVTNTKIISNASTEFHDFKLEWSVSSIKFYVDNVLFHTVSNSSSIPFNKDFFFLVNLAMGGNFGGPVDAALNTAVFEVDFIRVYK